MPLLPDFPVQVFQSRGRPLPAIVSRETKTVETTGARSSGTVLLCHLIRREEFTTRTGIIVHSTMVHIY